MRILIVDDDALLRKTMQAQIESMSSTSGGSPDQVFTASSLPGALSLMESQVIDVAFIDINLDQSDKKMGLKLLNEIHKDYPTVVVISMTGQDEDRLVEECLRSGASDYLLKPFQVETLKQVLRKAPVIHRLLRKNQTLKSQAGNAFIQPIALESKSSSVQALIEKAKRMRGTGHSILIQGESGSGKEILAQYLWSLESDEARPFIAVNCGAISASLAESELFGHKKGAFSGATDHRAGKFESAEGGDLFLDELATLPLEIQVKLLRVLSSGDITPVGADKAKKVSCRVIAATNENLDEMIRAKSFREDLFFRIKQFSLAIPPLRERKEDILDLANTFLARTQISGKRLSKASEKLLLDYSWPGNIRELKSAIEVSAVLSDTNEIEVADLKPHLMQMDTVQVSRAIPETIDIGTLEGNFTHLVREFERKLIAQAMEKNKSEAATAKFLGIPRSTLGDIRRRLKSI